MTSEIAEMTPQGHAVAGVSSQRLHVLLFDLLPTVPYYTGHLAEALGKIENVDLAVASATYTRDPGFFERMGVRRSSCVADFAYHMRPCRIRRGFKLVEYLLNLAALRTMLSSKKPDVIHIQFTPLVERRLPLEIWFIRSAKRLGVKLIYTVHNVLPHEDSKNLRSSYASLYRMMDHLICHDKATKDRLICEFGIEVSRISVIPHGPLFTGVRNAALRPLLLANLEPGTRVVLWQGIIRPYKGIPFLLQAWKQAQRIGMNAVLIIVGTADQATIDDLRKQIKSLGIESSVRLDPRFVSVEELAAYYDAADVVVYPYSAVTTSGALMTGIVYGKAIIASDLPVFRQTLQHQRNSLLVSHGDLRGWANSLMMLTSNNDLRNTLAQRLAEDRNALPDWTAIGEQTASVYRRL